MLTKPMFHYFDVSNWIRYFEIQICSCAIDGLKYERAWEAAGKTELEVLLQLKSNMSTKHDQNEIDHALHYFEKYIYDFPGEFFLQRPFIFTVKHRYK